MVQSVGRKFWPARVESWNRLENDRFVRCKAKEEEMLWKVILLCLVRGMYQSVVS